MAKKVKKLLVEFIVMTLDNEDRPVKQVFDFGAIVRDNRNSRKLLKEYQEELDWFADVYEEDSNAE
jgi:hypothetical protein